MTDFTELKAALSALTPDESQQLVVELEQELGIKVPRAGEGVVGPMMAPPPVVAPVQTEFTVELVSANAKKIQVIKVVRELTNLDLRAAKELVDGAPRNILEGLTKDQAEAVKAKLETEGATVNLK